jgi:hypothetical protein
MFWRREVRINTYNDIYTYHIHYIEHDMLHVHVLPGNMCCYLHGYCCLLAMIMHPLVQTSLFACTQLKTAYTDASAFHSVGKYYSVCCFLYSYMSKQCHI